MTKFKFFAILLCLFFITSLNAQKEDLRHRNLDEMLNQLDLTEDQRNQLDAHFKANKSQIDIIRNSDDLDMSEKKESIKAIHNESKAFLSSVLNEDQMTQMESLKKERRAEFQEKRAHRKEFREGRKRLAETKKKQLKEKRSSTLRPILKEMRLELDKKLSDEDKEEIADLKSELRGMKESFREERKALKEMDKDSRRKYFEALKEKNQPKRLEINERLLKLTTKYQDDIDELFKANEEALKAVKEELKSESPNPRRKHMRKSKGGFHFPMMSEDEKALKMERKENAKRIKFLLMPTEQVTESSAFSDGFSLNVFPNPSTDNVEINYSLADASNVKIELLNESGQLVQTLYNGKKEGGSHNLNVSTGDLKSGSYIVTIATENGVQSKKLIISN